MIVVAGAIALLAPMVRAQTFIPLGHPVGGTPKSQANAITSDGTIVVGGGFRSRRPYARGVMDAVWRLGGYRRGAR